MANSQSSKEIAAAWIARRERADWSAMDQARLDGWLNADPGHQIEYLRMRRVWQEVDKLKILAAGSSPGRGAQLPDLRDSPYFQDLMRQEDPSAKETDRPRLGRRPLRWTRWAVAACVVVAVGVYSWSNDFFQGERYSTPVGVTAAVPMADGSTITLNTDSQVRVQVSPAVRVVKLEHGEAFFEVAHDAQRPFVVHAGNKLVTAVGTKFSVSRDKHDVLRVIVTEGRVRIDDISARRTVAHVSAGCVANVDAEQVAVVERSLPEVTELVSWRTGFLVFHETTLREAVAEFNRYNAVQIRMDDPALGDIRISGNFRANNVDSFAQLLQQGYLVNIERQDDRIILTRR